MHQGCQKRAPPFPQQATASSLSGYGERQEGYHVRRVMDVAITNRYLLVLLLWNFLKKSSTVVVPGTPLEDTGNLETWD